MNRTQIIVGVQARWSAKRLPGKVMKPLCGHPVLWVIAQRLRMLRHKHKDCLLCTMAREDDHMAAEWRKWGSPWCMRGQEDNVLSRYQYLAFLHPDKWIVRLTADNPFWAVGLTDDLIDEVMTGDYDYGVVVGLPVGMTAEVVRAGVLTNLHHEPLKRRHREHVTLWIKEQDGYKKLIKHAPSELRHPNWRVTMDTKDDYKMLYELARTMRDKNAKYIKKHGKKWWYASADEVVRVLKDRPDLLEMNKHIEQVYPLGEVLK